MNAFERGYEQAVRDVDPLMSDLRAQLATVTAELDEAREALEDFAKHGLRADLNPTMPYRDECCFTTGEAFTVYLHRLDRSVRERALAALAPAGEGEGL
jgi:hypothetical protein